jgi:hypothetical protein
MGLIQKTLAWIAHPYRDADSDPVDWFAFFVLALIAGFLWRKVVIQLIEG